MKVKMHNQAYFLIILVCRGHLHVHGCSSEVHVEDQYLWVNVHLSLNLYFFDEQLVMQKRKHAITLHLHGAHEFLTNQSMHSVLSILQLINKEA